jgi:hypothetical protein
MSMDEKRLEQIDKKIKESKTSRLASYLLQLGGVAAASYFSYKIGASPVNHQVLPDLIAVGSGLVSTVFGTRIAIERGSALRRNKERELFEGVRVGVLDNEVTTSQRNGTRQIGIIGPTSAGLVGTTFMLINGVVNNPDAPQVLKDQFNSLKFMSLPMITALVGASAISAATLSEKAGESYESKPFIHQHLLRY